MSLSPEPAWVVVVPVKRGDIAKSRLVGLTARQRTDLARAFPADCAVAALGSEQVRTVVTITDDPVASAALQGLGAQVIPDEPDAGLNPALRHAHAYVRAAYGDPAVAVLSGDLPALRSSELSTALSRAHAYPRAFLRDHAGDGTTLLTAGPGADLDPRFGRGSGRHHRDGGAVELEPDGLVSVRRDVDTPADLEDAVVLGVGRHTRAVLQRHRLSFGAPLA